MSRPRGVFPDMRPRSRRSATVLTVVVIALAACGSEDAGLPTVTAGSGAESPIAAVEELSSLLVEGDFASASALAVPNHAALASLAEGATFSEVAQVLEQGDAPVAANFWGGFAQGVGEILAPGAAISDAGSRTEAGVDFNMVSVTPANGQERLVATRDIDGHRVDLFASFGAGVAGRMISPVEILLTSTTDDAALILRELQAIVPSLTIAGSDPTMAPEVVQEIIQLIELITRFG